MRAWWIGLFLALACGDDLPDRPPADGGPRDLFVPPRDLGPDTGPGDMGPCPESVPGEPHGVTVGASFAPFRFDDCDGRGRDLYDDDHCTTPVTVVTFGAGWCTPCFEETRQLRPELLERYGDDVRVVQVLFEDALFESPDQAFCRDWVDRFETTGVVTLIASLRSVERYIESAGVPVTFVLDGEGTIRFTEQGSEMGLPNVRAAIDALLAER